MKHVYKMMQTIALALVAVLTFLPAAKAAEPTVVTVGAAVLAGGFITAAAQLTGNGDALCTALGGKYTPENNQKGLDVCPGGSITNILARPK
jgi:hypothetical protein